MFEYSTLFLSLLKSNASYQENPDPAKKNKKIYIVLSFSPIKKLRRSKDQVFISPEHIVGTNLFTRSEYTYQ